MSGIKKKIIAGVIGIVYALVYGVWTLLITGGGHGNFIWFLLFFFTEFMGLYFPIMLILSVDLRSLFAKSVYGTLIGFNLVVSSIMINGWINEPGDGERASDYSRMIASNGIGGFVVMAAIHLLPTIVFLVILTRSFLTRDRIRD